jgi:hypothetical protein
MALETECEIHAFDPTQSSVPMPSTHRSGNENFHTYAIGNPAQNGTWQTKSLQAVMKDLGHRWINVLKMDIELGEWDFLDYMFKQEKSIPVGQVCMCFILCVFCSEARAGVLETRSTCIYIHGLIPYYGSR